VADPDRLLEGVRLGLRQVRYLTVRPGDPIAKVACIELIREPPAAPRYPAIGGWRSPLTGPWAPGDDCSR